MFLIVLFSWSINANKSTNYTDEQSHHFSSWLKLPLPKIGISCPHYFWDKRLENFVQRPDMLQKLLLKSQIFLPSPGSRGTNRSEKCKICGFIYLSFPNVKSKISGRQFLLSKNENLAPNIIDWNGLNPISWLAGYSHWILAATNLYSDKGPWTASLVPIDPDHTWA